MLVLRPVQTVNNLIILILTLTSVWDRKSVKFYKIIIEFIKRWSYIFFYVKHSFLTFPCNRVHQHFWTLWDTPTDCLLSIVLSFLQWFSWYREKMQSLNTILISKSNFYLCNNFLSKKEMNCTYFSRNFYI